MNVPPALVRMVEHVLMKRMDFTACVLRASNPRTVTPRWMNVAAAPVSMVHAERTSMGMCTYYWCPIIQSIKARLMCDVGKAVHHVIASWLFEACCLQIYKSASCTFSYRCDCEPGWVGRNCDLDRNDCLPSPCQNAGTCIDKLNGFTCKCRQGFIGKSCCQSFHYLLFSLQRFLINIVKTVIKTQAKISHHLQIEQQLSNSL